MSLIEPIGKAPAPPASAVDAGFVPREAEDALARHLLRPLLPGDREMLLIAGFDIYARLVGFEQAEGDATGCILPRGCWRRLLGAGAATVLMAHNHPSGIARPSDADRRCTAETQHFLQLVGVDFADHLIFVDSGHFSFRHAGLI